MMKNTRHCKACGQRFELDHRNERHHSYCPDASCQKVRRALAQGRRRANQATRAEPVAPSRLQQGLKPTEADILAKHPMFIGLLSMLTGSSDLQELQAVSRRLHDRGRDILGISAETIKKSIALDFQTAI
jgi:hypothetical protein